MQGPTTCAHAVRLVGLIVDRIVCSDKVMYHSVSRDFKWILISEDQYKALVYTYGETVLS